MDRLNKLKELEVKLYLAMEKAGPRELAGIAKQYRETISEIELIEGRSNTDDEIGEILSGLKADGKSRAVRKDRSEVSSD